ncbi:MAG: endonuclease domain-containing protein [Actinobacteria bacterium]|nr:MAG: endonuclease domain-containing protein [Actinomycetota bacterium]
MSFDPATIESFRYEGFDIDAASATVTCRYALGAWRFAERVSFDPGGDWSPPAVARAARLVYLLAGVSYYKVAAPPVIDFGDESLTANERALLQAFYVDGLGEYAFRNGLDLSSVELRARSAVPQPVAADVRDDRPLVPFGGGLDSIVTTELVRARHRDVALFVVSRAGDRFDAIEDAAVATELPIVRAGRALDPQILNSRGLGFRNGHVPVTGIISAIAVMAAVLDGRDAVVMSNEWSASQGNMAVDGRVVNHQYSKSYAFEAAFRAVLADTFTNGPDYFSLLRPLSELRIAQLFVDMPRYHRVFRSCNRAFHIDRAQRLDHWCGVCDKCCFIDLILAPFLPASELDAIFAAQEPLQNAALTQQFRTLIGRTGDLKPWECVGDIDECRAAVILAADRPDRATTALLHDLVRELAPQRDRITAHIPQLLRPMGAHFIPDDYATATLVD